jgi:hypothetical protein
MMKRFIRLALVVACLLTLTNFVSAQEESTAISPEKKKLITELITLTKAGAQVLEITDTMLESMERTYPQVIKQSLSNYDQLSPAQQDKISARLNKSYQTFSKKFRDQLPKAIDYDQYVNDTVYPLYDKYFTEKELSDLVAFYKTETGQKIVTTMPRLVGESTRLSEKLLVPKLLKLVDKLMQEEIEEFEEELTKEVG